MGGKHHAIASLLADARPWTDRERALARRLRWDALHLGEVAEKLDRSTLDVAVELDLGTARESLVISTTQQRAWKVRRRAAS